MVPKCDFPECISNEKEVILEILSEREMETLAFEKELASHGVDLPRGDVYSALKELCDLGLIFAKGDMYSITLLGKIAFLGLDDVYEDIIKRKDLYDFFKTRIPSRLSDEQLSNFKIYDDFKVIGKPDLIKRESDIMNETYRMFPNVENEVLVIAETPYKPTTMYVMTTLKKSPKIKVILSSVGYTKESIHLKIAKRHMNADFEVKVMNYKDMYMGLFCVDENTCFFTFRDICDMPGWDAAIITGNKDCVKWVKANFNYAWKDLAKKVALNEKDELLEIKEMLEGPIENNLLNFAYYHNYKIKKRN